MAAASPVVIHSSPPPSFQCVSTTPPSARQDEHSFAKSSSSPNLPSPSTFVRPRPLALKNGSKALPAPEGAKLGFVTAASLWKDLSAANEDNGTQVTRESACVSTGTEKITSGATVAGKSGRLTEPNKTPSASIASRKDVAGKDSGLQDVYDPSLDTNSGFPATVGDWKPVHDFAQNQAKELCAIEMPDSSKPKGRPRKKADLSTAPDNGSSKTKRSSKRKAKSEEIILNSDDPELDAAARYERNVSHVVPCMDTSAANRLQSKRKFTVKPRKRSMKCAAEAADNGKAARCELSDLVLRDHEELSDALQQSVHFQKASGRSEEVSINEHETAPSRYFSKPGDASADSVEGMTSILDQIREASPAERSGAQVVVDTVRRRRSWTPARDTEDVPLQDSRPTTAGSLISVSDLEPKPILTEIIGKFSYTSAEVAPPLTSLSRTPSGEAITKRRRIELVDTPAAESLCGADSKIAAVKAVRKKASKKRPQTITAVATAAFLPPESFKRATDLAAASCGSEMAIQQPAESCIAPKSLMLPPVTKSRKPRKSKPKTVDTATNPGRKRSMSSAKKAGRGAKPRKTVTFNELEHRSKLFSPERAVARIQHQSFIFGTSSQLAPAESTQFSRDMQAAVRESEHHSAYPESLSSPVEVSQRIRSPEKKSSTRVPTAPHGTSLSIEQGTRELWSIGSRDFGGGVLALEKDDSDHLQLSAADTQRVAETATSLQLPDSVSVLTTDANPTTSALHTSMTMRTVTTLCVPADREDGEGEGDSRIEHQVYTGERDEDSWMVLSSDGHAEVPVPRQQPPLAPLPSTSYVSLPRSPPPFLRTNQAIASPIRPALHPLDSNLKFDFPSPSQKLMALVQARKFTSSSQRFTPEVATSDDRAQTTCSCSDNSVPKKGGRPPKTAANDPDSRPKVARLRKAHSAIARSQSHPRSEWLDIDEISDSDSPHTPSPPRRRATSSPPEIPRLTLSPSKIEIDVRALPAPSTGQPLKPDGPQWLEVKMMLFPRITACLKSEQCRNDVGYLSWWEKMLMYDPIIVEDLTEWLNGQGVSVPVSKKKATVKGKKRKAGGDACRPAPEPEMETCNEPLQPWMVQKWCEEKSICCYLQKGSWRGGRTAKS